MASLFPCIVFVRSMDSFCSERQRPRPHVSLSLSFLILTDIIHSNNSTRSCLNNHSLVTEADMPNSPTTISTIHLPNTKNSLTTTTTTKAIQVRKKTKCVVDLRTSRLTLISIVFQVEDTEEAPDFTDDAYGWDLPDSGKWRRQHDENEQRRIFRTVSWPDGWTSSRTRKFE